MSWRLAKSLETLRNQVNAAYPNRSKVSDGTIGDAAHAASASDHNPNRNGVVCALDLTHDPARGFDAHALAEHLRVNRHPNLRYVISNARIAGAHTGWQWRPSVGHYQHCHISVGTHGVGDGQTYDNYDSTQAWDIGIKKGDSGMIIQNAENWYGRCNKTHWQIRGRELARSTFAAYVGRDFLHFVEDCSDDPEANRVQEWQTVGKLAVQDKWQQQIYDLQAALKKAPSTAEIDKAKKQAADLQIQMTEANKRASEAEKRVAAIEVERIEAQKAGNAFLLWLGDILSKITKGK